MLSASSTGENGTVRLSDTFDDGRGAVPGGTRSRGSRESSRSAAESRYSPESAPVSGSK